MRMGIAAYRQEAPRLDRIAGDECKRAQKIVLYIEQIYNIFVLYTGQMMDVLIYTEDGSFVTVPKCYPVLKKNATAPVES